MKNKIIIIVIVLILVGIGLGIGISRYYRQKTVNYCKERCIYGVEKTTYEGEGLSKYLSPKTVTEKVWGYWPNRFDINPERIFETQNQCIDYCLTVK